MDLKSLLQRVDDIESNAPSFKRYIHESVYNTPEMSRHWKRLDEGFFQGYNKYLSEAPLTPDQIQNIFKQAGGGAAPGADAAKDPGKLAAIVDKVLPTTQAANLEKSLPAPDAGPVQGFEQKAAAAVQNLPGVDTGTKQSLMQMVKAGIKKPETQQLILAAVSAGLGGLISKVGPLLSMIPGGGPVASAITGAVVAGGVAVLAAKLRGEDWKSAFKGAIKPALMGGASAVVGNLAAQAVSTMMASTGAGGEQPASLDNPKASSGQGAVNADPDAPVGGGMKNGDGTPMTNADMKKAMDQVAPVAGGDADPNKYYNSLSPDQQRATDDAIVAQAQANTSGAIEPRGGWGAQEKINAMMQQKADADYAAQQNGNNPPPDWVKNSATGKYEPPGGPADWANGNNPPPDWTKNNATGKYEPPSDYPSAGKVRANLDQWRADNAASGATAGGVPIGSTEPGINRLTGKPISSGPTWDQMTPDQQAATTARQQQQAADAAQGTQNAKDYWANKPANTRGLSFSAYNNADPADPNVMASIKAQQDYYKNDPQGQAEYAKIMGAGKGRTFEESLYDKQATLKEWLRRDAQGQSVNSVQLYPYVVEGIMDSLKGMFGGKKDAAAPAAGGVTADALNKAWTDAGSPQDSEEVAKILQTAGVPAETVTKIYADLKIPAPGAATPQADSPADASATPTPTTPADGSAPATLSATTPASDPASATAPATPGAEPPATPAVAQQSKVGVGQINKIIPTLRVRDLTSVKKNVDATLAKRGTPTPTAEGKYPVFYSKFLGKDI